MRDLDPRWIITGIVTGAALGLSGAQLLIDVTREPKAPQPIVLNITMPPDWNGQQIPAQGGIVVHVSRP